MPIVWVEARAKWLGWMLVLNDKGGHLCRVVMVNARAIVGWGPYGLITVFESWFMKDGRNDRNGIVLEMTD